MIGSIELVRHLTKTTNSYFTFGYYDTATELLEAVVKLKEMGIVEEANYYIRKDGYIAYYITIK